MKLLKEWTEYETMNNQAIKALENWYKTNLNLVHGDYHGSTEEIFGLPYTSSGSFAGIWVTNSEWSYKFIPRYSLSGIAISEDDYIVAILQADYPEKDILIPIADYVRGE